MVRGNFRRKSLDRQAIVKTCPNCEKQIPVACKTCGCGHKFITKSRANSTPSVKTEDEDSSSVKIRRTERTRRERPDYFNPLLLENAVKRPRKKSQPSTTTPVKIEEPPSDEPPKKKRGRPKGAPNKPRSQLLDTNKLIKEESDYEEDKIENENEVEEEEEIDMYADMPQERMKQFSFILGDLNRKFLGQGTQPR
ncbi:uncharacterized protein LOC143085564 [Mytilus galloprovincialis]|uniref:UPF0547 domain-containing protein n=2 Tax=Mytilus TaxID=6548 RepID=A0A8B6D8Y2_MYTGA|nr:unnamed protein product [Mytilus edulis]VDI15747.1 Hypothetical predicted protein [Mytilus galloprovincialis]